MTGYTYNNISADLLDMLTPAKVAPKIPLRARRAIERAVRASSSDNGMQFFSFQDLAHRWRCSRGTVRNRLRAVGAKVIDFGAAGQRGKKLVSREVVLQIEGKKLK